MTDIEEERIQAAMQIIGDEIEWATFCSALNITDGEARRLLHEMGHRLLAGFAGGLVTPSIYVVWNRRLAHRMEHAAGSVAHVSPAGMPAIKSPRLDRRSSTRIEGTPQNSLRITLP